MGWLQRLLGREALSAVQPGDAAAAREPSWQQLAPIEGTFTPAELTLRPARFEAELTTRQSPAVIGPMLHDVSIDGLPGYVEASAQPLGSDPPAEGTVRFPSPPPSLSRLGTSSETPPVPPETPPRLLPSLPAPPPGASLLDAGGVSLETMRIEVHDAPVPPSLADATTRATGDAAGWPTSAPSSPASGGTTEGVPAPQVPAPSASLVGGVTPSLPAAGLSGHGRGTPGDSGAPASPTAATPAGQGAGLLPAAGSSTQPPGVRESDAAWRTPTAAPVAQRQAAPPLMAGFSTPAVAEPLAGASWSALLPTVQTSPRRHHEGTPEHLLDPPPPPVKQVPAAAPRRVQRYRLGEPETRSEFPGALPAAPSPSGLSPARPSRPPAAPPPAMQPRPASAPPPPAATQRDRGGFPASSRLQAPPASPRSVAPPPAPAPVSAPVPDSPLPPPSAGGVARPVAAPEPAPLTLTALGGEGAAGPSLGEQPGPPAPSPAPPLELVPPPAAASPPEAAYPLLTPITSAGRLPSSLPPPVSEVPSAPARAILAQREVLRPSSPPSPSPGGSPQVAVRPSELQASPVWAAETSALRHAHPAGQGPPGELPWVNRLATGGPAPATPLRATQATVINFPAPADGPVAVGGSNPPAPPLQRQVEPAAGSGGDLAASEPAAPAPPALSQAASAPPPAEPPPGRSDAELDELGRRLYDRIRDHLAAELSLDRERAGLLNDLGSR